MPRPPGHTRPAPQALPITPAGGPLVIGLSAGWPFGKVLGYCALALLYFLLTQLFNLRQAVAPVTRRPRALYFAISGLVCLLLLVISGDPYLQPLVFAPPLVGV